MGKNFFIYGAALFFLLIFPLTTKADPITMLGLNWSMNPGAEMVRRVEERGYKCESLQNSINCVANSRRISITLYDERIDFNCDTFNGCSFSLREVAQRLVNSEIIDELKLEEFPIGFMRAETGYCGRGKGGDKICVYSFNGGAIPSIALFKGNLGATSISFE